MFIGREKELRQLNAELSSWKRKTTVLVYGKRRVGKSTLLSEAAKSFEGVVINHMCVTSTFEGNMELIYQSVSEVPDAGSYTIYPVPVHESTVTSSAGTVT